MIFLNKNLNRIVIRLEENQISKMHKCLFKYIIFPHPLEFHINCFSYPITGNGVTDNGATGSRLKSTAKYTFRDDGDFNISVCAYNKINRTCVSSQVRVQQRPTPTPIKDQKRIVGLRIEVCMGMSCFLCRG